MNSPSSDPSPLGLLFAQARAAGRIDTSRLEYGFETRLMARLRQGRAADWLTHVYRFSWFVVPGGIVAAVGMAFVVQSLASEADEAQTSAFADFSTSGAPLATLASATDQ